MDKKEAARALEKSADDAAARVLDRVTTQKAVEVVQEIVTDKAARIVQNMSDQRAAEVVGQVTTLKAAGIVGGMTADKGARVMEQVTDTKGGEIVSQMGTTQAARTMDQVDTNKGARIVEQVVKQAASGKEGGAKAGTFVQEMKADKAANVLEKVESKTAAKVMDGITAEKLTEVVKAMDTAALVERAVAMDPQKLLQVDPQVLVSKLIGVPTEVLVAELAPEVKADVAKAIEKLKTDFEALYGRDSARGGEYSPMTTSPEPITTLLVKFKRDLTNIELAWEKVLEPPAALGEGQIGYTYFNLSLKGAGPEDMEAAHLGFRLDKKWVEQNSIHRWSIALSRYDPALKAWMALPTKLYAEDDNFLYFSVAVPQFSTLDISGAKTIQPLEYRSVKLSV
ncbi:MAG: PGF-pre-PGF domain-containing protein, partial [Chloroflexota bacterium]|nr:PGF-pre-PGF domain-containing protein [Chloroflexota bacterium]